FKALTLADAPRIAPKIAHADHAELVGDTHGIGWAVEGKSRTPIPTRWVLRDDEKKQPQWFLYTGATDGAWPHAGAPDAAAEAPSPAAAADEPAPETAAAQPAADAAPKAASESDSTPAPDKAPEDVLPVRSIWLGTESASDSVNARSILMRVTDIQDGIISC